MQSQIQGQMFPAITFSAQYPFEWINTISRSKTPKQSQIQVQMFPAIAFSAQCPFEWINITSRSKTPKQSQIQEHNVLAVAFQHNVFCNSCSFPFDKSFFFNWGLSRWEQHHARRNDDFCHQSFQRSWSPAWKEAALWLRSGKQGASLCWPTGPYCRQLWKKREKKLHWFIFKKQAIPLWIRFTYSANPPQLIIWYKQRNIIAYHWKQENTLLTPIQHNKKEFLYHILVTLKMSYGHQTSANVKSLVDVIITTKSQKYC